MWGNDWGNNDNAQPFGNTGFGSSNNNNQHNENKYEDPFKKEKKFPREEWEERERQLRASAMLEKAQEELRKQQEEARKKRRPTRGEKSYNNIVGYTNEMLRANETGIVNRVNAGAFPTNVTLNVTFNNKGPEMDYRSDHGVTINQWTTEDNNNNNNNYDNYNNNNNNGWNQGWNGDNNGNAW